MGESKVKDCEVQEDERLIIFDCDGVLVDSEPLGLSILAGMLRQLGVDIEDDYAVDRFRGRRIAACLAEVERSYRLKLPEAFERNFRAESAKGFAANLTAVDGVADALDAIHTPSCVASSGPSEKIRLTLSLTGLLSRFDGRIFSAYEIGAWKPDPALFTHASREMGADPARTIVIEDSVVGVQAGVAAGMTVLGSAPEHRATELSAAGATTTFSTMHLLPDLISHYQSL
ncbi:hypothetical protein BTH42_33965 [Burkholderia sp. SRS-W-2-2016]|uniref:HAD family hydrolase n=1 Tax=Burkholderia sp. SRS-W-2-2016 TaxID=1926878 RepID=UPI00094B5C5B|nr:HAD family hydrolase [Burkholderia sp. SRS-W-2-2016]OLL27216.1 hypothetical protein BTH42_33965 [Burkholderia sp. SRS-W-2-2016]